MSTNYVQWNPTTGPNTSNQVNDAAFGTGVTAGVPTGGAAYTAAAVNAAFPSNVANKLFYQLTTFVTAFAVSLSNQGLTISDSNIATLITTLSNIVVSGVGANPTLGNVTCNNLTAAALLSTTGMQSYGGILSGHVGVASGEYDVVDSSFVQQHGFTGTLAAAISGSKNVVGGIIVS